MVTSGLVSWEPGRDLLRVCSKRVGWRNSSLKGAVAHPSRQRDGSICSTLSVNRSERGHPLSGIKATWVAAFAFPFAAPGRWLDTWRRTVDRTAAFFSMPGLCFQAIFLKQRDIKDDERGE